MEKDLFLEKLVEIENQYQEEKSEHKSFNIFRALHKVHDEKFLHSRFIAYLLSPESKHGMEDTFLKKFVEMIPELKNIINIDQKDLKLDNWKVYPHENDKSEKENIDILIINEVEQKAIIIENKIYAKDSNHGDEAQLIRYFDKIKVNENFHFHLSDEEARKNIQLVYLTINGKVPTLGDEFIKRDLKLILVDYITTIKDKWLDACIKVVTNVVLEEMLKQYRIVLTQFTNDIKRATELKDLISDNIKFALEKEKTREEITGFGDFKHVKWHTVFDFWNELTVELEKDSKVKIIERITTDQITKQTHKETLKGERKRIDRKSYGILIKIDETFLYITNDNNNGLTIGLPTSPSNKKPEEHWRKIDDEIKFSDFTNKPTFEIINKDKRKDLIDKTIKNFKVFMAEIKE
jgi:hypothetical protein